MNTSPQNTPATEVQQEEKQLWTTPELKKMDIEETAFFGNNRDDLDGFS